MAESGKPSVVRRWLGRLAGRAAPDDDPRRRALAGVGLGPWDWTGGRAFRPDNDDIVFDVTPFAARLDGRDGWIVDQAAMLPEAVERRLAAEPGIAGLVVLSRGRGQGRDPQGFARPLRPASYTAIDQGWAYDEAAACWRAPDEPLPSFPWAAERTDTLVMALGAPSWGWMPVVLAAGERTVAFKADCGACPFAKLVEWLERIAEGGEATGGAGRFGSLHGGTRVEFHAFPSDAPERVRVAVALYAGGAEDIREVALDIDIERRALVLALYGGLRAYAEGPDFHPFAWAYVRLEDELRARFPEATAADLVRLDAARLDGLARKLNERHAAPGGGGFAALTAWIADPTTEAGPPAGEGAVTGDLPDVPDAWDGWSAEQRLAWLPHLLQAAVSGWIGADLRHLRSARLERFLGAA